MTNYTNHRVGVVESDEFDLREEIYGLNHHKYTAEGNRPPIARDVSEAKFASSGRGLDYVGAATVFESNHRNVMY